MLKCFTKSYGPMGANKFTEFLVGVPKTLIPSEELNAEGKPAKKSSWLRVCQISAFDIARTFSEDHYPGFCTLEELDLYLRLFSDVYEETKHLKHLPAELCRQIITTGRTKISQEVTAVTLPQKRRRKSGEQDTAEERPQGKGKLGRRRSLTEKLPKPVKVSYKSKKSKKVFESQEEDSSNADFDNYHSDSQEIITTRQPHAYSTQASNHLPNSNVSRMETTDELFRSMQLQLEKGLSRISAQNSNLSSLLDKTLLDFFQANTEFFQGHMRKELESSQTKMLNAIEHKLKSVLNDLLDSLSSRIDNAFSRIVAHLEQQGARFSFAEMESFAERERKNLQMIVEYAKVFNPPQNFHNLPFLPSSHHGHLSSLPMLLPSGNSQNRSFIHPNTTQQSTADNIVRQFQENSAQFEQFMSRRSPEKIKNPRAPVEIPRQLLSNAEEQDKPSPSHEELMKFWIDQKNQK